MLTKGKRILVTLVLATLGAVAFADNARVTLSGYVRDASSGEALIGAVVYTSDLKIGVSANSDGFYSISFPAGEMTVKCSSAGYVTDSLSGNFTGPQSRDFLLFEDRNVLEAAKVFSHSRREEISMPQMGKSLVDGALAKKLPAMMGETDILRVIQMMPGVQTPSEGATGFSVRGGGIDQNLVLMDGAPVYNTGHFLGFISMFNGDAVKTAELYKGDFPSKYGGRTASVLDVSTLDGNINEFGGNASIGLITSKVFLEGPIVKSKLGFMLSARRTYLDLFFPLFKKYLPQNTAMNFFDINAKLNWVVSDKDRLALSVFSGRDVTGMAMPEFEIDQVKFTLWNNTQSLRYTHIFSPKLFLNLTLYNSRYNNNFGAAYSMADFEYRQAVNETGLRAGLTWYLNGRNTMEFGANLGVYVVSPGETVPKGESTLVDHVKMPPVHAVQPSLYVQNEQKLGPVTLRYGLRGGTFSTVGWTTQRYFDPVTHERTMIRHIVPGEHIKTYWGLEPRFSLSWSVNRDLSLKTAYSRSYQYLQQAMVSVTGSPVDSWYTASPNVKPQISDQVSLGVNSLFLDEALSLSLEGFYKHNLNTIDYVDNPGFVLDNEDREGLLRFGTSYAYGLEFLFKYDFDKISGWVAYTWSRAMFDIPEINGGRPYRSPLNHEHSVDVVFNYDIIPRVSVSADWIFYSGAPTTYPVGRYEIDGGWAPVYSSRNEDTMPHYHRLDISATYRTKRRVEGKRWSGEFNLSIYNLYNRHNAWAMSFGYNWKELSAEARKVYLFTIIPSLSFNLKF